MRIIHSFVKARNFQQSFEHNDSIYHKPKQEHTFFLDKILEVKIEIKNWFFELLEIKKKTRLMLKFCETIFIRKIYYPNYYPYKIYRLLPITISYMPIIILQYDISHLNSLLSIIS